MSTCYSFKCEKCQEYGGMYTRQAWGWGNFYVVETFKFLAFHTSKCGAEYIRVAHEDDVDEDAYDAKRRKQFLEVTKDYFPAYETGFIGGPSFSEFSSHQALKEEWFQREKKQNDEFLDYLEKHKDE